MKKALAAVGIYLAANSAAWADVSIAAQQIPGVYTTEGNGAYDQVYAAIEKEVGGLPGKLQVVPAGRAIALYSNKQVECQTPANSDADFYPVAFPTVQSKPFNLAKIYIFSKPGEAPVTTLAALAGKRVAVRQGFNYGKVFESAGLNVEKGPSIEANVKKLLDGRVDVLVDFVPDAWDAFAGLKMAPLPYDAAKPVAVHQDAVVCRDTPETRVLIEKINAGIQGLKGKGKLKELLGEAYIPE